MTIFDREFQIERLSDGVLKENGWLRDLLHLWHPSGGAIGRHTDQESKEHLRLAIRNGSLNFYRAGQSVAKVGFDQRENLQAKIHNKYVYGEQGSGQTYVTLNMTGLYNEKTGVRRKYNGLDDLRRWISNANQYIGEEKQFVDRIVARNPNVVDLEMALPAYSEKRTAPRMDLFALEKVGNRWKIVFWEAMLVTNPSAVCRGDAPPKVVGQLAQYTHWLRHADHCKKVAAAYQNACRLLVEFHEMAKRINPEIKELGEGITAAAASDVPPLLVDDEPRLLIDDHTQNVAFNQNGHLKKLRDEPCRGLHDWTLDVHL